MLILGHVCDSIIGKRFFFLNSETFLFFGNFIKSFSKNCKYNCYIKGMPSFFLTVYGRIYFDFFKMEINFENLGMSNFFQKYQNLSLSDWDKEFKKGI